jgi:hypothetical protein
MYATIDDSKSSSMTADIIDIVVSINYGVRC